MIHTQKAASKKKARESKLINQNKSLKAKQDALLEQRKKEMLQALDGISSTAPLQGSE